MLATFLKGASYTVPPTLQFGAGATSTTNATSYTFTSHAIGAAATNRYVVVLLVARPGGTDTGVTVTVGGQSCSAVSGGPLPGSGLTAYPYIFITDAPVTTGTTASVVVTYPVTGSACRISTYALYTTNNSTPNFYGGAGGVSSTQTINSPLASGEVGITMGFPTTSNALTSVSISGPATQNYNSGIAESSGILAATLTGSGTVTITAVGSGSLARVILATWR